MNIAIIFRITLVLCIVGAIGCSDSGNPNSPSYQRNFYMGFTPWPYDATEVAVNDVYVKIQNSGDIVAHHLMDGIPWEESLTDSTLPQAVENEIFSRLSQTQSNKVVYLSIDSLNESRDGLALNWGDSGGMDLPPPWDIRSFDDEEVIAAYSKFALEMIGRFNPLYFNYASEVSELILNDPVKFDQFVVFAENVYSNIKSVYPNLPLMVSIAVKSPNSNDAVSIQSEFSQIIDYTDIVGLSIYPYAFFNHNDKGDPANIPANWINQINSIAGTKPIAVTETGWIAEDLIIPGFGFSEQSDSEKQSSFVTLLLNEADSLAMEFVIWFTVVDYDALWNGILGQDSLSKIWKDTGLYDETFQPRPGLEIWNQYYLREKI